MRLVLRVEEFPATTKSSKDGIDSVEWVGVGRQVRAIPKDDAGVRESDTGKPGHFVPS